MLRRNNLIKHLDKYTNHFKAKLNSQTLNHNEIFKKFLPITKNIIESASEKFAYISEDQRFSSCKNIWGRKINRLRILLKNEKLPVSTVVIEFGEHFRKKYLRERVDKLPPATENVTAPFSGEPPALEDSELMTDNVTAPFSGEPPIAQASEIVQNCLEHSSWLLDISWSGVIITGRIIRICYRVYKNYVVRPKSN